MGEVKGLSCKKRFKTKRGRMSGERKLIRITSESNLRRTGAKKCRRWYEDERRRLGTGKQGWAMKEKKKR